MLELFGQNPKRQDLSLRHSLVGRSTVGKNAGNCGNLGDPAAVIFALALKLELHSSLRCGAVYRRMSRGA